MVAVSYHIQLPASPPPSPPSSEGHTAAGTPVASTSRATAALKAAISPASCIPTPDTSREEMSENFKRRKSPSKARMPTLDNFELIRVLGKGCAGRVLLVKHTASARVHAMKAISKRAVLANDELDHTVTEQEILRHFSSSRRRSPFISQLFYSFSDKENFYLVMEFYPGGDLATQMEIHGILGPLRTRFYTCDIVAGLEALHREGILVRDLKPENILLNWHGHAVLADFGLSKSFGPRGDPVPVKLPAEYISGKGTPPPYAGKGFGSYRNGELTWDRAFSFVGTQEYLAPEVIKRNHYTYAIDWWALGCIVCECLTGKVPFRGSGDESNAELYDRVINSPWDAMYLGEQYDPSYLKERYRIDSVAYDFIDGLLQKEPMFRLTEPSVKEHMYFANVDWATVDRGDYQDPHLLPIDPVAEYNTNFFPRLCLEETPTVDMSGHDYGKDSDDEQNALNNDDIYAKAQVQFRKELESFEWSCDWRTGNDGHRLSVAERGTETEVGALEERSSESEEGSAGDEEETVDYNERSRMDEEIRADVGGSISSLTEIESDERQTTDTDSQANSVDYLAAPSIVPSDPDLSGVLAKPETPPHAPAVVKSAMRARSAIATASVSARASVHFTPKSSKPSPSAPSVILPPASESPTATAGSSPLSIMTTLPVLPPVEVDSPVEMPALSPADLPENHTGPGSPRIPSGPPSSGLSVSDIISIPASAGQPLIIRRHRQMPSIDSYSNVARLSVNLNGTMGQLGDEEWEQLDANALPEAPNGGNASGAAHPNSLFARSIGALGRRSSPRGLGRRTFSTSRSSSLRKVTPSESASTISLDHRAASPNKRQPLFASRGLENTKRALGRITAFPPPKGERDLLRPPKGTLSASPSASGSGTTSLTPSASSSIRGMAPISRPVSLHVESKPRNDSARRSSLALALAGASGKRTLSARNGDLQGLFVRPKTRRHEREREEEAARTSLSFDSGVDVGHAYSGLGLGAGLGPVPRVELSPTPPIVWEDLVRGGSIV